MARCDSESEDMELVEGVEEESEGPLLIMISSLVPEKTGLDIHEITHHLKF